MINNEVNEFKNELLDKIKKNRPVYKKPTPTKELFKDMPELKHNTEDLKKEFNKLKDVLKNAVSQKGRLKAERDPKVADYLKRRAEIKRELKLAKKNKDETKVKELKELYDSITINGKK